MAFREMEPQGGGTITVKWSNATAQSIAVGNTAIYLTQEGSDDLSKYRLMGIIGYEFPASLNQVILNRIYMASSNSFMRFSSSASSAQSVGAKTCTVTCIYQKID